MIPEEIIETPVSLNMTPYTGVWTKDQAAHLLRRTMFGATYQQIQTCVTDGMNASVTNLLSVPVISPPLTTSANEGIAAFNTTWVNSVYPSGDTLPTENARVYSLASWTMEKINKEGFSIAEKMCLFWHNHFAAEATFDSRATYNYHNLIRTHALGNFKQLIKEITVDPCILFFLNGVSNQSFSPNENYARELLELYTIGKGPLISTGDYTNYKEQDVSAGSKILTGWTVDGMKSTTLTSPFAVFNPAYHDISNKTLSSHFNNTVVSDGGDIEYQNYIDIIFQQPEVAHFICRKIYRYFVNYDLTTDVETNVIPILAQTLIDNNYSILSVMQQLLTSEHFYDISLKGTIIKNPCELLFSMLNTSQSSPNYDLATNYEMYLNIYSFSGNLGQSYLSPPNVGGWTSYYQLPSYSRLWINSTYLKQRFDVGAYVSLYTGIQVNGNYFKINALQLLNGLSNPASAQSVINDLCLVFFPKTVDTITKTTLKTIMLNGLPDFEWSDQYIAYSNDTSNSSLSNPIKTRIETVLYRIFQMPEFQTI